MNFPNSAEGYCPGIPLGISLKVDSEVLAGIFLRTPPWITYEFFARNWNVGRNSG